MLMNSLTVLKPSLANQLIIAIALLGILSSRACLAQANENRYKDWYQIEIIIFSRAASQSNENLPKNIVLAYPTNIRYLQNPDAQQAAGEPAKSELEARLQRSSMRSQLRPFTRLGANERSLNREKNIIEKQRGYKVLAHEAWRQPVGESNQAISVIIEGGSQFGKHFELEGALTVTLSRYLHAKTNFWLTQFEPNYGQENHHWPELPSKPINLIANRSQSGDGLRSASSGQGRQVDTSNLFAFGQSDATQYTLRTSSIASDNIGAYAKKPYFIKRIHTMKQSRRMRSGELHYIDHPLSGMIIQIKPYKPNGQKSKSS